MYIWRIILIPNALPAFLAGGTTYLPRLFRLPVGLFTTFSTAQFVSPLQSMVPFPLQHAFLFISLVSLLLAYTIHRANTFKQRSEHILLVEDILDHQQFLRLKEFQHHTNHIYDHATRVSYLSYRISKSLGLDYVSAARGGLLHDFFLYDWRQRKAADAKRSSHGKDHPHIALENAKTYFSVNAREEDIIVKHMFPKTHELPRYPESIVVSISDKLSAIYEYLRRP
ncbi:HD domain-containing protein [Sphaerochaeta sp.]|uniref:HD domain-containing protein n=1 Tax=Sphaerochaeta sp. TaxID=1972642 RepID=UPI003D1041E2